MTTAVPGLRYISGYLDVPAHDSLLAIVDAEPWRAAGSRRSQVYGYSHDQTKGGIYRLGDLPPWAHAFGEQLQRDGLMLDISDQMIVNEYAPGQGIAAHVDGDMFTDTIITISLASACVMELTNVSGTMERQLLEPGSALVLSGEARSQWKHSIPARAADLWMGRELQRARRVSLSFRKMLLR